MFKYLGINVLLTFAPKYNTTRLHTLYILLFHIFMVGRVVRYEYI